VADLALAVASVAVAGPATGHQLDRGFATFAGFELQVCDPEFGYGSGCTSDFFCFGGGHVMSTLKNNSYRASVAGTLGGHREPYAMHWGKWVTGVGPH
jgi:hypothetical protein